MHKSCSRGEYSELSCEKEFMNKSISFRIKKEILNKLEFECLFAKRNPNKMNSVQIEVLTFNLFFFPEILDKMDFVQNLYFSFKQDRNSEQNQFCSVFFIQRTKRIGRAQKWRRCWQKTVSRNSVNRSELAQTYAKLFSTS